MTLATSQLLPRVDPSLRALLHFCPVGVSARSAGERKSPGARIGSYLIYVPTVGFVIATAIALAGGTGHWQATTLEQGLTWLVGVQGIIAGSGHLLMPRTVAQSIGWPASPFQWEVGLAGLGFGICGVMAPSFGRGFQLATIIVFSVFMLGAAVGHVRSMIRERNFAPGNAGYIFWYDIAAPVLLIVLYLATR